MAIGWTGQGFFYYRKEAPAVRVTAGVDKVNFYLEPGERIRTASVLLLPYEDGRDDAHNLFRRTIKENFSLKRGEAPVSFVVWGGADSEFLCRQIDRAEKEKLGFECLWVDAGWYGDYEEECPDEFTGKWWQYVGDWMPNKRVHQKELKDVFARAEKAGMRPLLWIEPERARKTAGIYGERPELFIALEGEDNVLLDLSREDTRRWMFGIIDFYVNELNLYCYRQDFNMDPLPYWENRDTENRKGITQIKHITGMYEVWDNLLTKYPNLIIDNCASGGRRIDIETLKRSIPLHRSDLNCDFDFNPNHVQNHTIRFSYWLPYHGCGAGKYPFDIYRARSCQSSSFATSFLGYGAWENDEYDMGAIQKNISEFKSVQRFFACDYYSVFGFPRDDTAWAGWQFHDPETNEGIVAAFRRDESPCGEATVFLGGLSSGLYKFENADTGESSMISSAEIVEKGFSVAISEKGDSRLFRYKKI